AIKTGETPMNFTIRAPVDIWTGEWVSVGLNVTRMIATTPNNLAAWTYFTNVTIGDDELGMFNFTSGNFSVDGRYNITIYAIYNTTTTGGWTQGVCDFTIAGRKSYFYAFTILNVTLTRDVLIPQPGLATYHIGWVNTTYNSTYNVYMLPGDTCRIYLVLWNTTDVYLKLVTLQRLGTMGPGCSDVIEHSISQMTTGKYFVNVTIYTNASIRHRNVFMEGSEYYWVYNKYPGAQCAGFTVPCTAPIMKWLNATYDAAYFYAIGEINATVQCNPILTTDTNLVNITIDLQLEQGDSFLVAVNITLPNGTSVPTIFNFTGAYFNRHRDRLTFPTDWGLASPVPAGFYNVTSIEDTGPYSVLWPGSTPGAYFYVVESVLVEPVHCNEYISVDGEANITVQLVGITSIEPGTEVPVNVSVVTPISALHWRWVNFTTNTTWYLIYPDDWGAAANTSNVGKYNLSARNWCGTLLGRGYFRVVIVDTDKPVYPYWNRGGYVNVTLLGFEPYANYTVVLYGPPALSTVYTYQTLTMPSTGNTSILLYIGNESYPAGTYMISVSEHPNLKFYEDFTDISEWTLVESGGTITLSTDNISSPTSLHVYSGTMYNYAYIRRSVPSNVDFTKPYAISLYVKILSNSGDGVVLAQVYDGSHTLGLYLGTEYYPAYDNWLSVRNSSGIKDPLMPLELNRWYKVVLSVDPVSGKGNVSVVDLATGEHYLITDIPLLIITHPTTLWIGDTSGGLRRQYGDFLVDDLEIYQPPEVVDSPGCDALRCHFGIWGTDKLACGSFDNLTVAGGGAMPGDTINVTIVDSAHLLVGTANATADSLGEWNVTFTIPITVTPCFCWVNMTSYLVNTTYDYPAGGDPTGMYNGSLHDVALAAVMT
ncbi:MAG: hypothetical protein DRN03_06295, partial [Thermoplasmata archaeon]